MKIDTQGMSLPLDPNYKEKTSVEEQRSNLKPATIRPRRLFTETYAKEMKKVFNLGIGYCLVVPEEVVKDVQSMIGLQSWVIGDIIPVSYTHLTLPTICSV